MPNVFESLPRSDYKPVCWPSRGRRAIITRNGMVFGWLFNPWVMVYSMPKALILSLAIGILSLMRRGVSAVKDDELYGFVHSPWTAGYYHWITESLPRAMALKENYPSSIPLLPSQKYKKYSESLSALGFDKVVIFPDSQNVLASKFILTSCPPRFATTSTSILMQLRERIRCSFDIDSFIGEKKIVYVSRKKSRGRTVVNEDELIKSIADLNPVVICFEDLTFYEQVKLMSEAQVLISIHGAGLANSVFMDQGANVIELLPKRNGLFDFNLARMSFRHDACYARLSADLGLVHDYLEGTALTRPWGKTHMADIEIDPELFRGKVGAALGLV